MSNQLQATGAVKVRSLTGVITGTTGVLGSLPINGSLGIPQLDVNGKILVSQLPNSVMEYLGTWDASTNTPTLVNGTGNAGDVYLCNVAGTVNFGAGPISFVVSDQVIYSGSIWQKASGSNGTVTSVAVTESGDALTITGSPITTSGTINIGFAGTNLQYINGQGNLTTFPSIITEAQKLVTEVYNETGATLTKGTVVYINGGQGNLPTITKAIATGDATSAQTYGVVQTDITNMNNGYVVVIGSLGDLDTQAYANGTQLYLSSTTAGAWTSTKQYAPAHLVYVAIVTRSHPTQGVVEVRIQNGFEMDELHNVSAQSPTNNQGLFYNTSTSLWENKSIATALGYTPVGGSGSDGQVAFFNGGSTTLGGSANFYWDNSTSRLGIGSNTPNASLGILNSSSTGIQVRTSDSANQYQANIFYDASYGMVYGYNRLGTGTASNLTFFNNIGGFISIPESATNNIGFNTINPQGLAGASVYDFTSLNTNVELRLHNSSTGYTSSDGSFIRVTSTALVIANAETSKSIFINNGGLEVITIDATNKVAIGSVGVVPMTQQLTVIGSIEAYGGSIYQTVTSSMLKANASGQIIAAIAGTDYLAVGSAVTSVTATSPILSSGGTTPNISIPAATTSVSGYLTSTDWTTFNNKFTLPSLTQGSILFSDGSTIAQNNNRLYWNNSTMRLGVGSQPVAQYVMYVKANVGENANAWLGIDNDNATGSTALRLILNGSTTSGFQYVQSTNMTQVYANAGDIQLINGSSLGLTIANTTGNASFSGLVSATSFFQAPSNSGYQLRNSTDTANVGAFTRRGLWEGNANYDPAIWAETGYGLYFYTNGIGTPVLTIAAAGAATFSSSATATSFVKTGGTSSQFLKADGSVDSTTYGSVTSVATSAPLTGGTITTSGTIGITQATTSTNGYLSSTDWNTFNGKFTLPSLTSGSVLFSNGSTIAQDNANFFWDDVNNRLGIGTATPESILHILGASAILYIDGNSAGTQTSSTLRLRTGGFNVGNFRYNVATDNIEISNISAGGAVTSGAVKIYGTSGSTTGLTIAAAGGGTFASTLTVGTTGYITTDLYVGDTTSGGGRFFVTDASNQGIVLRRLGSADRFKMFVGNGTTYTQDNAIILGTNTDIDFYTGASPVKRLTIANSGAATFTSSVAGVTGNFTNSTSGNTFIIGTTYAGGRNIQIGISDGSILPTAAAYINDNTGVGVYIGDNSAATKGLYVKNGGNVGIGVTPNTWFTSGGYKVLQIGAGMSLDSGNDFRARIASNAYVNTSGDWIYSNTGFATNYSQTSGQHIWQTAPSGTSGNAITFTDRMTISSGGDVSIGGVTPSERLDINHSSSTACFIRLRSTAGSGVYVGNRDNNLELWSGGTKNMTISSTGAVILQSFSAASTSGNLLFNYSTATADSRSWRFANDTAEWGDISIQVSSSQTSTSYTTRFNISRQGNVGLSRTPVTNTLEVNGDASKTTAGSWLANSDINIKTNINTIEGALDRINKVRLVSFKYKDAYKEANNGIKDKFYHNVIAQEFQEIYPDYVYDSGDVFEEHKVLQVDTNPMYVDSVSAIQELSKMVIELQNQINELKNK